MARKPITKKVRFEVFKRDLFTCQYCGCTPPKVTLEVDHINPVSKGGKDDINNLITACFDCNRGKSNIPLDSLPETLKTQLEVIKERQEQLKEYEKVLSSIRRYKTRQINRIDNIYNSHFPEYVLSDHFKQTTLWKFIEELGPTTVIEAMEYACNYIGHSDDSIKYFCGICWNKIKGI